MELTASSAAVATINSALVTASADIVDNVWVIMNQFQIILYKQRKSDKKLFFFKFSVDK
jgi:hypothetical protein